jgi:hypothetical protein
MHMVRSRGALGFVVATLMACVLMVAGCGSTGDSASWAADFEGTWSIIDYRTNGESLTEDQLAIVQALGIYLNLGQDGTGSLELLGDEIPATWEATADKVATITIDEKDSADFAGEDEIRIDGEGHLTMKSAVDSLTFEKIDPSQKSKADLGSLATPEVPLEATDEAAAGKAAASTTTVTPVTVLSDATELDDKIASDDRVEIRAIAKGAYDGDLGYLIEVENKGDDNLFVSVTDPLEVDGATVNAHLQMGVNAHETGSEVLWAGADEAKTLDGATGTLVVTGSDGAEIATYPFGL